MHLNLRDKLIQLSRYVVADAYFSVSNFVDGLEANGFHLVSRFRSDADLMYLYTGERTGKKGRPRRYDGKINFKELDIDKVEKVDIFNDITLYASPYLVATDKGYTKHYYAGSERVCAKLGSGGLDEYGDFLGYDYELTDAALNLYEDCVKDAFVREPISDGGCQIDTPDGSNNAPIGNELEPTNAHIGTNVDMNLKGFDLVMGDNANDNRHEEESFFYHSDHLGSASWITDKNGIPVQHLMYMPFGESYVDEHTSYQEQFTFTGKETDCETGFSYFGARYYAPRF